MKECNKLVRHLVPEHIKGNGMKPQTKVLNDEQYKKELLNLLVEEAREVTQATDPLEFIVELADVREVIDEIIEAYGLDKADLTRATTRKVKENGSYNHRIYLTTIKE